MDFVSTAVEAAVLSLSAWDARPPQDVHAATATANNPA